MNIFPSQGLFFITLILISTKTEHLLYVLIESNFGSVHISFNFYLSIYKPAVVSGVHKKMNMSLWKSESISLDFGDHQADLLNCKDSIISNGNVKEFWDGFEELSSTLVFVLFVVRLMFLLNILVLPKNNKL